MLDCARVQALKLRFTSGEYPDIDLGAGALALARRGDRVVASMEQEEPACARIRLDRRGIWLSLAGDDCITHVNGRPVRRLAMLRVGDAIHLDGIALMLLPAEQSREPLPDMTRDLGSSHADVRIVLRGLGGRHHGRSFSLKRARVVGRLSGCDIRIDDPAFPERHARLELQGDTVLLRSLGSGNTSVLNGVVVRDAVLRVGDQLVFDSQHRFVVESPGRRDTRQAASKPGRDDAAATAIDQPSQQTPSHPVKPLPWLLLAALAIAAALSGLLLFGASG